MHMAQRVSLRSLAAHRASWRLLFRQDPVCSIRLHHLQSSVQVAAVASAESHALVQPPVEPPPVVPYNAEAINSVVVSGMALNEPQVYHFAANQVLTHVRLGLRPPAYRADLPQQPQGAITVDAWGLLALQLSQHVRKGSGIQVRGVLRQDSWTDRVTGQPRRAVKIIAEDLALLAPGDQHLNMPPPYYQDGMEDPDVAPLPPEHMPQPPLQQAPQPPQRRRQPHMGRSAEQTLHMYQVMGLQLETIAAARGIKTSTVVTHLLAAAQNSFTSWQRLASDLQLGPTDSDDWLSPAEVAEAVMAVEAESPPGTELAKLSLRSVRQRLADGAGTAHKVAGLLSSHNGDPTLLYGAIKLVCTMLNQGVSFAIVSSPPPAAVLPPSAPPF